MYRVVCLSLFLTLFSFLGELRAEAIFDRDRAVRTALAENPELQAARLSVERAQARALDAGRLENPVLAVGGRSDFIDRKDALGGWSIELEQRLPITSRLRLERDLAAQEITLAAAELRDFERQVALAVERAFDGIASVEAARKVHEAQIENDTALRASLQRKVERAEASPVQVRQIEAQIESERQQIRSLERARSRQLDTLRFQIGFAPDAALVAHPPAPLLEPLPPLADAAVSAHPGYRQATALVELAASERDLARASRWDDIAVALAFEEDYTIDEPFGRERERFLGLTLSIPLPLHQRREGSLRAAGVRYEQRLRERDAFVHRLQHEAASLQRRHASILTQIEAFHQNLQPVIEDNLAEIERAYRQGQVDLTTLFEARRSRLEQENALLALEDEARSLLTQWRYLTAQNLPTVFPDRP